MAKKDEAAREKELLQLASELQDEIPPDYWNNGAEWSVQGGQWFHSEIMSGSFRKLFRESHRDLRLKQWQPGHDTTVEVRPMSLTPSAPKLIRIKDNKTHERKH